MTDVAVGTLADFLLARIAEDEERVRKFGVISGSPTVPAVFTRLMAECEAKRRIIEWHKNWPVIVERSDDGPAISTFDADSTTLTLTRWAMWATEQEYVKRFGVDAPTGPILRFLALPYADHPDFREEWRG